MPRALWQDLLNVFIEIQNNKIHELFFNECVLSIISSKDMHSAAEPPDSSTTEMQTIFLAAMV